MPNSSQFKSQTSLTVGVRTLGPSRHCCEFPSGYTKRGPPQRRATLNSMESWITSTVLGEKHPCFLLVWHHDLKNFYQFSFHDSTDSAEQWRSTMPPQSKHGWPWQSLDADLASEVRHGPSSSRKTITIAVIIVLTSICPPGSAQHPLNVEPLASRHQHGVCCTVVEHSDIRFIATSTEACYAGNTRDVHCRNWIFEHARGTVGFSNSQIISLGSLEKSSESLPKWPAFTRIA